MKKHQYSQHNLKTVGMVLGIFLVIFVIVIGLTGEQYKKYLNKDEYPNCMKVEEFDVGENDDGCLRHTKTLTPDYQQVYSLSFETFYMDNQENAERKYQSLLTFMKNEKILNQKETIISDSSKVTYYEVGDEVYFVVKSETTLYIAHGIHQEMDKKQKWFDVLHINYQV